MLCFFKQIGGNMMGGPPRSDMTPPIQMTTGHGHPQLLVPAGIQTTGAPHQYTYVPQNFPPVSFFYIFFIPLLFLPNQQSLTNC